MIFKTITTSTFLSLTLTGLSVFQTINARTFAIFNHCPFTIWPAAYTGNPSGGYPGGDASQGGWQLDAYHTSFIPVPDNWQAGRFWARTECDFGKQDVESCATGSCIGGLHCSQPGIPPVTLAEFTLSQSGQDNYDVSAVDGINLPISITSNGCPTADCSVDLNPDCPAPLQLKNANGYTVGCKSACKAYGGDHNCCAGGNNLPSTCPADGVDYFHYFHDRCPNAYAFAYDDANGLKTCSGGHDYTITFCP